MGVDTTSKVGTKRKAFKKASLTKNSPLELEEKEDTEVLPCD